MEIKLLKSYKADKMYEKAHTLFIHDEYSECEEKLMEILDYYPEHLSSMLLMAQIAWNNDHFQKSWERYNKALQLDHTSKDARIGRAKSSYNLYRFEDSLDDYLTLYEESFKKTDYLIALGDIYQKLNLQTIAVRYYQKALKFSPSNIDAHVGIAYQYIILGAYKNASDHITKAKELYYEHKDTHPVTVLDDIQQLEKTLQQLQGSKENKRSQKK